LSESAFQPRVTRLPPELDQLDWDAWRVIRFRNEPDPIQDPTGRYKLGVFHLGHLFKTEVKINLVVNGATKAFDYSPKNFEYAQAGFGKNLPANLGYAGFRISFPLNSAKTFDELISFVGASYFRFLGRDQKYGLSARGLAIGSGNLDNNEEFPFFREFWIEQPAQAGDKITIYALLDTPSLAGAYQFDIYPQDETALNVTASVYPRVPVKRLGMAPLTSMSSAMK
jgi:glucans biosynthesis protein